MRFNDFSRSSQVSEDVVWRAHCRLSDREWREWGKILVWADRKGLYGPSDDRRGETLWFRWADVKDVDVRRVTHGLWVRRFAVGFVFKDESRADVELMVSGEHWWGFYSPVVAVETAAWLREFLTS